jgi:hypothetical protein
MASVRMHDVEDPRFTGCQTPIVRRPISAGPVAAEPIWGLNRGGGQAGSLLALQRVVGNGVVSAVVAGRGVGERSARPSVVRAGATLQRCRSTGFPGCDCPQEALLANDRAPARAVQRQPDGPSSDVGNLILRRSSDGTIEFLYETPDVPVTGPIGIGFRCRQGRCEPVGGQQPSDISNRTYTVQEALEVLRGASGGSGTPGIGPLGGGGGWPTVPSSPGVPFPICLPWEQTPSGRCCPPGQRWSGRGNECAAGSGPTVGPAPIPGLTLPPFAPPTLGVPHLRLGLLQLRRLDHFAVGEHSLPVGGSEAMNALAAELNAHPDEEVRIAGHTDSTGTRQANQRLSERRAQAVARALMDRGVDAGRLVVEGFGERRLRNTEERTPEEAAENRRVEVSFHLPVAAPGTSPFTVPGGGGP